jgi:tetratricopeptide (TPR) repeat protein
MFELKPISKEAIPRALARAERYRLLNEPQEAESICRDVLRTDPDNQEALVMLLLAVTDQFGQRSEVSLNDAREVLGRLHGEYERAYYDGVISERWGKAQLRLGGLGHVAHEWLRDAMSLYEKAEALTAAGNEEAALRWNACVRMIERDARLEPRAEEPGGHADFGDEPPV